MRATKEIVRARVEDLLRIMLDGAQHWDLCDFVRIQERRPGSNWFVADGEERLSYSQIRRYANKAERFITKVGRESCRRLLGKHLAQRRNLYARAVSAGDIRVALACLQDEATLLGLYDTDHTDQDEEIDPDTLTPEDAAAIDEIFSRAS